MQKNFKLYSSPKCIKICFFDAQPVAWYEVTGINDQDMSGKLYGSEIFLYEDPHISLEAIRKQIQNFTEVELDEFGLLYVTYRPEVQLMPVLVIWPIGLTDDQRLAVIEMD
jgi:hypothetical protein